MEYSATRKDQIKALLERKGMLLDESYIQRGRELLFSARSARANADAHPVFSQDEVEEDMFLAHKSRPRAFSAMRITAIVLYILGLLSLLLPIDPFMSRLPICGIFVGLGGILFFSDILNIKKKMQRAKTYKGILNKYDVEYPEDIPTAQAGCFSFAAKAKEVETQAIKFIRFADDRVSSLEQCEHILDRLEALVREYRSL